MAVENFSVSVEKIKLRYRERYITEGVNEKALAIPRGCYRGFIPRQSLLPDKTIWLAIDPLSLGFDTDSFAVYTDENDGAPNYDGWALSIRETADVPLDLTGSPLMPAGQVLPGASYFYIYITAVYQIGSTTVVTYAVSDVDPVDPKVVKIGRVPVTPGNTTIAFDITNPAVLLDVLTGRKYPAPTSDQTGAALVPGDSRWGYLDSVSSWRIPNNNQKEAMINANSPSAANPFAVEGDTTNKIVPEPFASGRTVDPTLGSGQLLSLNDWWYVGNGTSGIGAARYFKMGNKQAGTTLNAWESAKFLTDDSGISIYQIWNSAGTAPLDPSVDADAEGFYQNPKIEIVYSTSQTASQDFWIYGYQKSTIANLRQAPVYADPQMVPPHARDISAGKQTTPPLWIPTAAPSTSRNVQAVLNQHHQRLRGTMFETMRDQDLAANFHSVYRNDGESFAALNAHYLNNGGSPWVIEKIVPWRVDGELSLVLLLRDAAGSPTGDRIGIYDPVARTLVEYDYASLFPAPVSAWVYDDITADADSIYVRASDSGNAAVSGSRVHKILYGLAPDPAWPATGVAVGPHNIFYLGSNWLKMNRVIVANDSNIAVNVSGNNLFGATQATPGVHVIRKSDGVIIGTGSGDCTTGGAYVPLTNPQYAMGPMMSDGVSIYFTTFNDPGPGLTVATVYQCRMTNPAAVVVPGWGTYFPLGGDPRGIFFDGWYVWAVGQQRSITPVAGQISVSMQRPLLLTGGVNVKSFDPAPYPNSDVGGVCFDGKNMWVPFYDATAGTYQIAKMGVQRADQTWQFAVPGSQSLATLVRDFHGGAGAESTWAGLNEIYADPAFDGENIWYAPEQNVLAGAGRGWLFRIPNIMGY